MYIYIHIIELYIPAPLYQGNPGLQARLGGEPEHLSPFFSSIAREEIRTDSHS